MKIQKHMQYEALIENVLNEPHTRYSYKVLENVNCLAKDISLSLINNCIINKCLFKQSNLSYVDFQGSEFTCCEFIDIKFNGAEISSCNFNNCTFLNCNFDGTKINDCQFTNCKVLDNSIHTATVNNIIWKNCFFKSFCPLDVSLFGNDFIRCTFIKCTLTASIYYAIFEKCKFSDSIIDSYLIGFQYGLSLNILKHNTIVHFSDSSRSPKEVLKLLHDIYSERKQILQYTILDFFSNKEFYLNLVSLLKMLKFAIENNYIVKVDEIKFIRRLIDHFFSYGLIAPINILSLSEITQSLDFNYLKVNLLPNTFNEILLLHNSIYINRLQCLEKYDSLMSLIQKNRNYLDNVTVEFIYKKCPKLRLFALINEIEPDININILYEREGSFHEFYNFLVAIEPIISLISLLAPITFNVLKKIRDLINKKKKQKNTVNHMEENSETLSYVQDDVIFSIEQVENYKTTEIIEKNNEVIKKTYEIIYSKKEIISKEYSVKNFKNIRFN